MDDNYNYRQWLYQMRESLNGYGHAPRGIMLAHYHTHTGDQAAEQGDWNVALYHWEKARDAMEA